MFLPSLRYYVAGVKDGWLTSANSLAFIAMFLSNYDDVKKTATYRVLVKVKVEDRVALTLG